MRRQWHLLVVALLLFCSCRRSDEPAPRPPVDFDTQEVGSAADAELETEFDELEPVRAPEMSGILPSEVPDDLPIYTPSSLVDFSEPGSEVRYLVFDSADSVSQVRAELQDKFERGGWQLEEGRVGAGRYRKAGRQVTVQIAGDPSSGAGCRIRVEY